MKTIEQKRADLNENLKEIAPQVTKAMRMQWAVDNGTSLATVDRYMKGEAKYVLFAEKLYRDMCTLLSIPEKISIED